MKKFLILILFCSNAAFAQQMVRSGTIYSEHPYLTVVRRFARQYGQVNPDDMAQLYADTTHFYSARYSLSPKGASLNDAKKSWQDIIDNWQDVKMVLTKQPEGFEYTRNQVFIVQSHWSFSVVNKKTNKTASIEIFMIDEFNDAGKIAIQREYYDPTPLLEAMKP
jgi:hypothetical protein